MSLLLRHGLLLSLLSLVFVSCELFADTSAPLETGLAGQVLAGPQCPVIMQGNPCPDKPFSASFDIFDSSNRHVSRFESDAEGFFEVALKPGLYSIVPDADAPLLHPRSQSREVTVEADTITEVTLLFDTGIR